MTDKVWQLASMGLNRPISTWSAIWDRPSNEVTEPSDHTEEHRRKPTPLRTIDYLRKRLKPG